MEDVTVREKINYERRGADWFEKERNETSYTLSITGERGTRQKIQAVAREIRKLVRKRFGK